MQEQWLAVVTDKLQSGDRHEILHEEADIEKALTTLGLTDSQRDAVMDLMEDQWELGFDRGNSYGRTRRVAV